MTEGDTQLREKERERDSLRNKLKETRAVEVQVNELRTQIKKNEATRKVKLQQGKDFSKEKEKIIEQSKASALFILSIKKQPISGKPGPFCSYIF
jgi:thioredoxin reductase